MMLNRSSLMATQTVCTSLDLLAPIVIADNLVFAPHPNHNSSGFKTAISGLTDFRGMWTDDVKGEHCRIVRGGNEAQ